MIRRILRLAIPGSVENYSSNGWVTKTSSILIRSKGEPEGLGDQKRGKEKIMVKH